MKKSFTLIELLVVIAIIGLLVIIIAIPINRARQGASIARILQYEASLHRYLGSDIVGWWKLDGDLTDISGNNNHGTWEGSEDPQYVDGVPGKEGYALEFDGSGDYVEISDKNFANKSFTYSAWILVKNRNESSHVRIIDKGATNWDALRLSLGYLYIRVDYLDSITHKRASKLIPENTWIHVVGINNSLNKTTRLYINGVEPSYNLNSVGSGEKVVHSNKFIVGGGSVHSFDGLISDVRIYNRIFTSEEINTLYTETKNKYFTKQ